MSTRILVATVVLALVTGVATPAVAQDAGTAPAAPSAISSKEMIGVSQAALKEIQEIEAYVSSLIAATASEQDPVKDQCLNKKLAAVRALIQVSEAAQKAMTEALAEADDDRADYEFRKIGVARDKARQFRSEADVCVGDEGQPETRTSVEYKGNQIETEIADGNDGIGTDPPGVSPFE